MQAGDLRSRVAFYQRVAADDGYGNTQGGFAADPEFTVAANLRPKLGGEAVLAGRLTGKNTVNITVRRSIATVLVTTDWIAKDARSGEIFNIRSIVDPGQGTAQAGRYLEMLAEKGVAE